nr:uncharacterized protein CTRU02_06447 [Colletotrichum truncatum]KAF6792951.1 hypothetical protein CTRU02_06447 [Colletotrichum truncatum]
MEVQQVWLFKDKLERITAESVESFANQPINAWSAQVQLTGDPQQPRGFQGWENLRAPNVESSAEEEEEAARRTLIQNAPFQDVQLVPVNLMPIRDPPVRYWSEYFDRLPENIRRIVHSIRWEPEHYQLLQSLDPRGMFEEDESQRYPLRPRRQDRRTRRRMMRLLRDVEREWYAFCLAIRAYSEGQIEYRDFMALMWFLLGPDTRS